MSNGLSDSEISYDSSESSMNPRNPYADMNGNEASINETQDSIKQNLNM